MHKISMRNTGQVSPAHRLPARPVMPRTHKWGSPRSWLMPGIPAWSPSLVMKELPFTSKRGPVWVISYKGHPASKPKGITESQVEVFRYHIEDAKDLLKVDECLFGGVNEIKCFCFLHFFLVWVFEYPLKTSKHLESALSLWAGCSV